MMLSVTGCVGESYSDYFGVTNVVDNYDPSLDSLSIFLEIGQSTQIDFAQQFKDTGIDIAKVEAYSTNRDVFTVTSHTLTAVGAGQASLTVEIFNRADKLRHFTTSARVRVIDRNAMIKINSAQDLANINLNKAESYILNSDIDLTDWGEWEPIGEIGRGFSGIFVNPDGYVIKNLTINTVASVSRNFISAGLFASIERAYIDGIILENVNIDVTEHEYTQEVGASRAGGIAAYAEDSTVRNCTVEGVITAQGYAGGILGYDHWGRILDCNFSGTVQATHDFGGNAAGGIVGLGGANLLKNCHAQGTIDARFAVGGIMGRAPSLRYAIVDSTFTGELLNAIHKGDIIGYNYLI